jgi:hopanoid biosynthesis associated protein HpnK
MTRKIIINADDFGLCEGVNQGIVKAHTEGVLTSATLMTNMQCAEKAAALAKSLPSLGVGIHLNLTDGRPLAKDRGIGTLCNVNGEFAFNPYQLCSRSALSAKIREAIRMELQAQIQWTLDQGITPTHLDSHKHVHCFPVLFKIVCELAGRFGISAIRWPLEKQPFHHANWPRPDKKGVFRSRILRCAAEVNARQNSSYFKTTEFLGIAHTGRIDTAFFKAVSIYNQAPIVEIMTHPGFKEGLDATRTRLVEQREMELRALCSEQTKSSVKEAGIQLVHYGQL